MKGLNNKLNQGLAIAIAVTIGNLAQAQPASAQLLELATGALNILGIRGQQAPQFIPQQPPQPQNRSLTLGTENFNGNTLNLCFTGCLPTATRPTPPPPVFMRGPVGVPPQGNFSSSTVRTQTGNLPPGAQVRPGVPGTPQGVPPRTAPVPPRPQPRRPILNIPPIPIPINLGN